MDCIFSLLDSAFSIIYNLKDKPAWIQAIGSVGAIIVSHRISSISFRQNEKIRADTEASVQHAKRTEEEKFIRAIIPQIDRVIALCESASNGGKGPEYANHFQSIIYNKFEIENLNSLFSGIVSSRPSNIAFFNAIIKSQQACALIIKAYQSKKSIGDWQSAESISCFSSIRAAGEDLIGFRKIIFS